MCVCMQLAPGALRGQKTMSHLLGVWLKAVVIHHVAAGN